MTIITITISLEVDNNTIKLTQHKEVNVKDIISLLTLEELNPKYKDVTLGEMIEKYTQEKNLKPNSIRNYDSGLSFLFGVNYKNIKLTDICSKATINKFLSKQISQKSFEALTIILNYAVKKKLFLTILMTLIYLILERDKLLIIDPH